MLLRGFAGAVSLLLIFGCGEAPPPELGAAEVFTFGEQPVSIQPPPEDWRRERSQNGGQSGVRWIKKDSVGEAIDLVEILRYGQRDRCLRLQALLDEFPELGGQRLRQAVQEARPWAQPPINASESRLVERVDQALDLGLAAALDGDAAAARERFGFALELAQRIVYELDEVIDAVAFGGQGWPPSTVVEAREATTVGGKPAYEIAFSTHDRGNELQGRRLYVFSDNRLFALEFIGLEENLSLFDRVVASVSFPPGPCRHAPPL